MSHLDLEGLQKYAQKERKWADNAFDSIEDLNWQKSEKNGIVPFYPLPEQPIEPIIDFLYKEVLPEEGTKGPSNPSTIVSVDSIKLYHNTSNLLCLKAYSSGNDGGVDWVSNGDGSFTFNGTVNANYLNGASVAAWWDLKDVPNGSYRVGFGENPTQTHPRLTMCFNDNGTLVYPAFTENVTGYYRYSVTNTKKFISLYYRFIAGYTFNNITVSPYLILGDYEYDVPVDKIYNLSLGGNYYGGTYDMANGVITKSWDAVTLTGQETWYRLDTSSTEDMSYFYTSADLPQQVMGNALSTSTRCCTHFPILINGTTPDTYFTWGSVTRIIIRRSASLFPNADTLKNWLASEYANGTPVIIAYKLYTPQIVHLPPVQILSLPQIDNFKPRLNTLYTNANSIQVGYPKHPLRTQYELDNAILSLGGNE